MLRLKAFELEPRGRWRQAVSAMSNFTHSFIDSKTIICCLQKQVACKACKDDTRVPSPLSLRMGYAEVAEQVSIVYGTGTTRGGVGWRAEVAGQASGTVRN